MCLQHCQICASDRCGVVDAGVDGVFSRFRPARVLADGGVVLTPMDFESIGARVQANNAHHVCIYTTHAHVENTHSRARCECRRGNMKWLRPWNLTSCWFSLSLSLSISLSPPPCTHIHPHPHAQQHKPAIQPHAYIGGAQRSAAGEGRSRRHEAGCLCVCVVLSPSAIFTHKHRWRLLVPSTGAMRL